jgi:hypothetical protein
MHVFLPFPSTRIPPRAGRRAAAGDFPARAGDLAAAI